MSGIFADSSTDVWAVGGGGQGSAAGVLHFDGKTWALVHVPVENKGIFLNSVVALSPKNVWAVGATTDPSTINNHELVEHFDGTGWKVVSGVDIVGEQIDGCTVVSASLQAVTAVSSHDLWVAGNLTNDCQIGSPFVQHFDGRNWQFSGQLAAGSGFVSGTNAISGLSDQDIWVAGGDRLGGQAELWHFDGVQWKLISSPAISGSKLASVAAITGDNVWAVGCVCTSDGSFFATLTEHFDGQRWAVIASPNPNFRGQAIDLGVMSVSVVSSHDIWATGFYYDLGTKGHALALHWNGSQWSISPTPRNGATVAAYAVSVLPQVGVWLAGTALKGGGPPAEPFVLFKH